MKDWEALKALDEGHKVRGTSWPQGSYLYAKQVSKDFKVIRRQSTDVSYDFQALGFEYEIYEEPGHDWAWAKEQLRAGKKVKLKEWKGDVYLFLNSEFDMVYQVMDGLSKIFYTDLDAEDSTSWVLYD